MLAAEIFVVRVYRRRAASLDGLVGVVDLVGSGQRRAFHSIEELATILRDGERRGGKAKLFVVPRKGRP